MPSKWTFEKISKLPDDDLKKRRSAQLHADFCYHVLGYFPGELLDFRENRHLVRTLEKYYYDKLVASGIPRRPLGTREWSQEESSDQPTP